MQFSKFVSSLARTYNLDHKDVFLAILIAGGATAYESYSVVFRPKSSTNTQLSSLASKHISDRPNINRLIGDLRRPAMGDSADQSNTITPPKRRGRPRKEEETAPELSELLDYTDKDAILREYAGVFLRAEKPSDKLTALNNIANLQRMKQEAKVEEEKRVMFYIPLSYEHCDLLLERLGELKGGNLHNSY